MISHTVKTTDGRTLNVAEDGDKKGKPVFALHGTPGSLILYPPHVRDAFDKGIRLISYDRPGYGRSSPHPGRKVADAAKDVLAVADFMGLDSFAVWGISGGGPHSLACAALLGSRVVGVSSLASPAPYPAEGIDWFEGQGEDNVEEFRAAISGPLALTKFLEPLRVSVLDAKPEDILKILESLLPTVDREALKGELGEYLTANMKQGLAPGIEGAKEDDLAFVSDWGFDLTKIRVPVLLWQGRHDKMVPYAHGEWLAERLRVPEVRLLAGDGHITLYRDRVPETHAWLLGRF